MKSGELIGIFVSLRLCAAQLSEPEQRSETRSRTGRVVLPQGDCRRNSHRSYLQTYRYIITIPG